MKLAFFVFPHLGGTFTVFRHLRSGLAAFGIDVRWVGVGRGAQEAVRMSDWQQEWASGDVCGRPDDDEPTLARALLDKLSEQKFDGVVVSVQADPVQTNITRYLPSSMLRLMIVHSTTPATYAAAGSIRDHVHAVICVSQRIRDDLVRRRGFDPGRTFMIGNACDSPLSPPRRLEEPGSPLRLLSLGRIEDQAKGVFWLPEILQQLPADVELTVAGDGPDLHRLKQRSLGLGDRIRFNGRVRPEAVAALMAEHEILLGPSRFEGFMITVVEAMAAGCVPVVSRIRGVTDTIIENGGTGLLFPVGDVGAAAAAIRRLREEPSLRLAMSRRGPGVVRERYSVERMGAEYVAVIDGLRRRLPPTAPPLSIADWRMPRGLRSGLRTRLPTPLKNFFRMLRERSA